MKFKYLSITLLSSALLFTSCNNASSGGNKPHVHTFSEDYKYDEHYHWHYATCGHDLIKDKELHDFSVFPTADGGLRHECNKCAYFYTEGGSQVDEFEKAVSSLLTGHNYSLHLVNLWSGESTPWTEYNLYNLNDDAMYEDLNGYFEGYIKQKNQGIVNFTAGKTSGAVLPGSFESTNTALGISDIYSAAPEHFLDKEYVYSSERNAYVCSSYEAMKPIANLAFGEYAELVSCPEDFIATYNATSKTIKITIVFDVNYYDETPIHKVATVTIDITNIGATSESRLESYVTNPTSTFEAPTKWENSIKTMFDSNYHGYYPPFVTGLTYSYRYLISGNDGKDVVVVEDYASGNLTSSYASILKGEGYRESVNPSYTQYLKEVEDGETIHKYYVKMKFTSPDTPISGTDKTYGYLYPKGVMTIIYLYKTATKEEITTIAALNNYIAASGAGGYLPAFNLPDTTAVSGFVDSTASSADYAFAANRTGTFKIYPASMEEVNAFVYALEAAMEAKNYTVGKNGMFHQIIINDEYGSSITFTDPDSLSDSFVIDMQIIITNASIANQPDPVDPDSYSINVSQVTGATITVIDPTNDKAKEGDTVKFKVTLSSGYELNSVSVISSTGAVSTSLVSGVYQFSMPASNITITANVSKKTTYHSISYVVKDSDGNSLSYDDVIASNSTLPTTGLENESIHFSVITKSGYKFTSASIGSSTYTSASFNHNMGTTDIVVNLVIDVDEGGGTDPEAPFGGDYCMIVPKSQTNPDRFDRYTLRFDESTKTGQYIRECKYSDPESDRTYSLSFSYTVKGSTITLKLVSGRNTDFEGGYRLFQDSEPGSTNPLCTITANNVVHVALCKADTSVNDYFDFVRS